MSQSMGGNQELVTKVLRTFYETHPSSLTVLRDNVENADWTNLSRNAHAIKGASTYLYAASLQKAALRLYNIAQIHIVHTDHNNVTSPNIALLDVEREMARVLHEINIHLQSV